MRQTTKLNLYSCSVFETSELQYIKKRQQKHNEGRRNPEKDHNNFSGWQGSHCVLSPTQSATCFGLANTDPSQVSPVQQVRQPLSPVPLNNTLTPRLLAEAEHKLGQLVTGVLSWTEPPVHDVNTWQGQAMSVCVCVFVNVCVHPHHRQQGLRHVPLWSNRSQRDWWSHWGFPSLYTHLMRNSMNKYIFLEFNTYFLFGIIWCPC